MSQGKVKALVQSSSAKHRGAFVAITGGFEERGILNSEMLAICSLSEELGVEVFIESGRWRGQSTEVLVKYFAGKNVLVESVEAFRDANAEYVEQKMRGVHNLGLHYGDANWLVPHLVRQHRGKRMALLFDGPKGRVALDVFRLALAHSDTIVAGFFHDMRQTSPTMPSEGRAEMEADFPAAYYTDDSEFVEGFSAIDQGCEGLWKPFAIDNKPIGSYGPTVGIVMPTREDIESARRDRSKLLGIALGRAAYFGGVRVYHATRRAMRRSLRMAATAR